MRCKHHKRYRGLRKPRISCEGCWWIWFYGPTQAAHKITKYLEYETWL